MLAVVETHHGHGPGQRLPLQCIGNVALALRLLRIPVFDFELVKGVHCRQHMLEGGLVSSLESLYRRCDNDLQMFESNLLSVNPG